MSGTRPVIVVGAGLSGLATALGVAVRGGRAIVLESSGLRADGDGHVLNETGDVIPGLFAVGSVAALTTTGSGYNSGFALSRGLTVAYLVAQELAPAH